MTEESGLSLLDNAEVRALIQQRLKAGYVIILGDPKLIEVIEINAYPPRTSENKLFELLLSPTVPGFGIFLAKKTKKLAELLGNPPDLDKTIGLEIVARLGDTGFLVNQVMAKEGRLDSAIQQIIERIIERKNGC